jgi:atrophin-1 interacting protein 1
MSHWSEGVCESVIRRDNDGALNIRIRGGAEDGTFPYFGPVESNKVCDLLLVNLLLIEPVR